MGIGGGDNGGLHKMENNIQFQNSNWVIRVIHEEKQSKSWV